MKESTLQLKILKHLQSKGYYCWRNGNLARYDPRTGTYLQNPQHLSGLSDIICILNDGRHCAIEVKTEKGRQSPAQAIHAKRLTDRGAVYLLVRSVEEVESALSSCPVSSA